MEDLFSSALPKFKQEPLERIYALLHRYKNADKTLSTQMLELEVSVLQRLYEGRPYVESPQLNADYSQHMAMLKERLEIAKAQNDDVSRDEALLIAEKTLVKIVKTMGAIRVTLPTAPQEYISSKDCASYPNIAFMVSVKEAMKPLSQLPIDQFPDDNFPKVRKCVGKANFLARLFVDIRGLQQRNNTHEAISDETFAKIMRAVEQHGLSDVLAEPLKLLQSAQAENNREKLWRQAKTILPMLDEISENVANSLVVAYDEDVRTMSKAPCHTDVPFVDSENQHPVMRLIHRKRWEKAADIVCAELDPIAYQQGQKASSHVSRSS